MPTSGRSAEASGSALLANKHLAPSSNEFETDNPTVGSLVTALHLRASNEFEFARFSGQLEAPPKARLLCTDESGSRKQFLGHRFQLFYRGTSQRLDQQYDAPQTGRGQ